MDVGRVGEPTGTRGSAGTVAARPGPTIARYLAAFAPAPPWETLPHWPPDVFALANLVLDHTEAYRFAVAPPRGRRWPPVLDWNARVIAAAHEWRATASLPGAAPPSAVRELWAVVTEHRDLPMSTVRTGEAWPLCEALLTLHAMADEASAGLATRGGAVAPRSFEARAWGVLAAHGSLAHLSAARVRVLPKTHFAGRGVTIRSFSRYLSLCFEAVDVRWERMQPNGRWPDGARQRRDFNLMLVPWPLAVRSQDFHEVDGPLDNMDQRSFGFFEFAPRHDLRLARLAGLVATAQRSVRTIDAVILPEAAIDAAEVDAVEAMLDDYGVIGLIAGVRERSPHGGFGANRLHIGMREEERWRHLEQAKHHRWCLDGPQIRQYHLTRALDPAKQWWEAIDLPERRIHVLDTGGGTTAAPLICEDLARLDEVADVLRRIGPSLVIAVLLDGPQLSGRWPNRYASILADDPGSAVLTLTCLGMATRSRPDGTRRSRTVALWNDATSGLHQIELDRRASALLITASVSRKAVWTADGRRHDASTPELTLSAVRQLTSR